MVVYLERGHRKGTLARLHQLFERGEAAQDAEARWGGQLRGRRSNLQLVRLVAFLSKLGEMKRQCRAGALARVHRV